MNILLIDGPEGQEWLSCHFDKVVYSPKAHCLSGWIVGALSALLVSRKDDVITCWFDFQAILVWFFSKLFFKKGRIIVAINIMLKDKPTLKNRIVSNLYRHFLASDGVKATVTSSYYGEWLNKKLQLDIRFSLLHDVYHSNYQINQNSEQEERRYVFCGGKNGRDWKFMLRVSAAISDVVFVLVMPQCIYETVKNDVPSNIQILHDVPLHVFMSKLNLCSMVCLPLDTEAPAGLIVMFQAAANNKMVITTDTPTTQEYISHDRGIILPNNEKLWIKAIRDMLNNSEIRKQRAENLKKYLESECSEVSFVNRVFQIIGK